MRGTPRIGVESAASPGIIPAYAGNTPIVSCICPQAWDHPRVCGEHPNTANSRYMSRGSSPRMRGTHVGHDHVGAVRGIIPAYAGNTLFESISADPGRDHPRVCGEHQFSNVHGRQQRGSSPRMRGTPAFAPDSFHRIGIIPAYAGNTGRAQRARPSEWDHPRVCGEHGLGRPQWRVNVGSSPRMRGTPCACTRPQRDERDHPRVCGEHDNCANWVGKGLGSSPRMRGTRDVMCCRIF